MRALGFLLLLAAVSTPPAPDSGPTDSGPEAASYSLTWWTVDAGGGASADGGYFVNATIGQADAGGLDGGLYTLTGGFHAAAPARSRCFLPLVLHAQ